MPQIINTNIASLNAQRNLNNSQADQSTALQRLSSGLRINSARDDAAGLAISTRFETQVEGLTVAIRNANDGVSLSQVAEGALGSLTNNLQRIRELALQSANDTNSALDRQALNAEVKQLLQEIDSVAEGAAFNGRKLLDGSFERATFQTGANVGDTISFTIAEASLDTLGTSTNNGISSFRTPDSADPLTAGDLVINGVAVGSALASSDTASTGSPDKSAISKVAAINKVSDQSEVTATVNENTVGGRAPSGAGAASITINGTTISLTTSAGDSANAKLSAIVTAVNEKAGVTGVRAEIAPDSDGGVNLIAEDGRNIILAETGSSLQQLGLAPAGTYIGTYSLLSKNGSAIEITSNSGNITNAGLQVGSYSGGNSGVINTEMSDTVGVAEGDLVINGVAVGATEASYDNASTDNPDKSAIALATAINKVSEKAGVTAVVGETRVNSGNISGALLATSFDLNGVEINVAAQSDVAGQVQTLVDAVNAVAGQTGVTAEVLDGDSYTLIAKDGRNIHIDGVAGTSGLADGLTQASVTLESGGPINLTTNTGNIANSGFQVGVFGGSESGQRLKDVDISTVKGALNALAAVDNALQAINIQRADLGAIQNRFESAISSQAIAKENLAAANSRIKDADFAEETAALSRSQVLQQAGTTILAQANGLPQQVLSLLQG